MPKITQWERHIGRHLHLRDLFVLLTVVESGSMSKAAAQLGVSTPSVSTLVAALEHELGTQLLDRTPKGVVPTLQGEALLARARRSTNSVRGSRISNSLPIPLLARCGSAARNRYRRFSCSS